jgi:hypothetical protein
MVSPRARRTSRAARGVGLQERQECLLDGEVAGVTRGMDLRVADQLPGDGVGLEEAALVGRQVGPADGGDVRRERDQVVIAAHRAVGVADFGAGAGGRAHP